MAVNNLCPGAPVFAPWSASWADADMCFKYHKFPLEAAVTGGEMAACQSPLVDTKLIYTFRIILYD